MMSLPRILIVDDEPVNLSVLINFLEADYEIQVSKSGEHALSLLKQQEIPDIILLDIQLPGANGYEILKQIKTDDELKEIPIIFITSKTSEDDEEYGLSLGASDYITKPFNPIIVQARIRIQIENKKAREILNKKTILLEQDLLRAQKVGEVGIWKVCLKTNNIEGSPEFYRLLGIRSHENIALDEFKDYVFFEDRDEFNNSWNKICDGDIFEFEFRTSYDEGKTWLKSINEFDECIDDMPVSIIGTLQNITKEKIQALRLEDIAYNDYLTGLPNKYSFEQSIENLLKINKPIFSIHFVDIDGLYNINSKMNDAIGDHVICTISSRLRKYINSTDILACIGGDKFGIAIQNSFSLQQIDDYISQLQEIISNPIHISNDTLHVTACVGSSYTNNTIVRSSSQLLRMAENALYQSKLKGKNKHTCFSLEQYFIDTTFQNKLERIRTALSDNEFVLFYQPKINIITNELVGLEALIRWEHPDRGLLGPGEFIPLIEGHPLTVEVGDWVINSAVQQQQTWKDQGLDTSVSVNISTTQFEHPTFVKKLKNVISIYSIKDPSKLDLEILESGPLINLNESKNKFNIIKKIGITLSLDDFGTGHSSLQFLKDVRPDIIKIDRSFISEIEQNKECQTIVQAILDLGIRFNAMVIAEGLETESHKQTLISMGCSFAQGYGIAKPMHSNNILTWLKQYKNL